MKDDLIKKIQVQPTLSKQGTDWVIKFLIAITHQKNYGIDLRLQKILLQEISLMLERSQAET